jgi:hypothetical protein
MTRVLHTAILAGCLVGIVLAGTGEAVPVQLHETDSNRAVSCSAAQPAFADFDQNGIADRVDSGGESGRTDVSVTLNGRQRIILAQASEACRLLVLDIDQDDDADVVALTTTGRLLVWLNQAGVLGLVQPRQTPDAVRPKTSLRERARPPDSIVFIGRNLPCTVPSAQAYVSPSRISPLIDGAGQHRVAGRDPSASRGPPTC